MSSNSLRETLHIVVYVESVSGMCVESASAVLPCANCV